MRKVMVMLLLAVLPFQFVWGAAAAYCQHEQGSEVTHFGHHFHKHQVVKTVAAEDSISINQFIALAVADAEEEEAADEAVRVYVVLIKSERDLSHHQPTEHACHHTILS